MIHLSDVFDLDLLDEMKAQKYVREQVHPLYGNLRILNYSETAVWENVWNEVTSQSRGLIYYAHTGEVLARPFRKFFNYGQEGAPEWSLDTPLYATDKMDGSLGIMYTARENWNYPHIATRGSFDSEQARVGTRLLRRYLGKWEPDPDWTYLFEIIYPENRIVVDYQDFQDLVLIGAVQNVSGKSCPLVCAEVGSRWPGPVAETLYDEVPFEEILKHEPRENREGLVLWNQDTDERMKIKYEDYVRLHRLLTNVSVKNIWEVLSTGQDPEAVYADAPDEFHDWIKDVVRSLQDAYTEVEMLAIGTHQSVRTELARSVVGGEYTRKDFALEVQSAMQPYRGMAFTLESGGSISDAIWKHIKPTGSQTFKKVDSGSD